MTKPDFTIGVIISTYNNPRWLEKTLWGYLYQTVKADEIIIADDGSRDETRQLIESFADRLPIRHVWQPDNGFRKSIILNKALVNATADYLIFTDQDVIPRADFIETHVSHARKGRYLSGGYVRMNPEVSNLITHDDIRLGICFDRQWLLQHGLPRSFKNTKLIRNRLFTWLMNTFTPAKATWNGCNASGWRTDLLATNGFNEQMGYGGQDREFGARLENTGIRPVQMRYSLILLHLFHNRPYRNEQEVKANKQLRIMARRQHIIETPYGIKQHGAYE